MKLVKLVEIYRRPKDIDAFEKVYQNEHILWLSQNWREDQNRRNEGTCFAAR